MICPTCKGKPQHPPCMECGGTGFSHCCDGPPQQPEMPRDPPLHKIGDIILLQFRNNGYSAGLQYPYIYGDIGGQWIIWHRHTGEVVYIETSKFPALHHYRIMEECDRRNGIGKHDPYMNVLHDLEP